MFQCTALCVLTVSPKAQIGQQCNALRLSVVPVFGVALCAQLSTRSKLLRRSHFREQAGYKLVLQLGGPAVMCSQRG